MTPARLLQEGCAAMLLIVQPACSLFGPQNCDAYAAALLLVTVTDSETGQSIGIPFTVTVISETAGDSIIAVLDADVRQPFNVPEGATLGSSGDYTVDVRAEGYQTWRRGQIRVSGGACGHPNTRSVTAALLRL